MFGGGRQESRCIADRGIDLGAVADYAGIGEEPSAIGVVITGDAPRVEAAERQSERPSLSQNRDPGKTGLEALQGESLE